MSYIRRAREGLIAHGARMLESFGDSAEDCENREKVERTMRFLRTATDAEFEAWNIGVSLNVVLNLPGTPDKTEHVDHANEVGR